ncbi:hypothetical protein QR680_006472 [Steinernema hermaphroditum]|uniref:Uncharacterized protein n=1 Tax=Steinernema hermaphroditum TaxID=289476 RepID=A0AA39HWU3_9BILA|nr:hypothetical protein QR680_006472 [Steinernema hermaphroditum]
MCITFIVFQTKPTQIPIAKSQLSLTQMSYRSLSQRSDVTEQNDKQITTFADSMAGVKSCTNTDDLITAPKFARRPGLPPL